MQAIKDKITDLNATRKARSEAKHEEKAEKELAKSRADVAHEIRLAREAEASMNTHVNKAVEKAAQHDAKLAPDKQHAHSKDALSSDGQDSDGKTSSNIPAHLSKFM
uniref:late embryogenesis abundant protein 6-like n=1 Tax=Erigeron canadensis TaxID=72917 RepID=UPI001CB95768|nr:late embryogenesis abundant protein 6-like [Erigeron canadensis]